MERLQFKSRFPKTVNGTEFAEVIDFRSQRFTELVVSDNKAMLKKDNAYFAKKYMKHNVVIRDLVKYVNDKGNGWTVVGWFRRGESADSSTEGATAESFSTTLHISLLVPSKQEIRNLKDGEFNQRRLSVAEETTVVAG